MEAMLLEREAYRGDVGDAPGANVAKQAGVQALQLSPDAEKSTKAPVEFGVLVINGVGTVVRCNDAAISLFEGWPGEIEGMPVSALLPEIATSDSSPSYNMRYIAFLISDGNWRRFRAMDIFHRPFPLDVAASKISNTSDDQFLLYLRRPEDW
jgi:PAS domain-containing protein